MAFNAITGKEEPNLAQNIVDQGMTPIPTGTPYEQGGFQGAQKIGNAMDFLASGEGVASKNFQMPTTPAAATPPPVTVEPMPTEPEPIVTTNNTPQPMGLTPTSPEIATSTDTTTTTTKGTPISPEILKEVQKASLAQQLAIQDATKAGKEQAATEAAYYQGVADIERLTAEESARKEEYRQKEIAATKEKIDKQQKEIEGTRIDGTKYWSEKSAWQQALGAIAVGLGAYASAVTKTDNYALKILQTAIDRDIDSQKANLNKKQRSLEATRGTLKDNLIVYGDQRAAELATKMQLLKSAEVKFKEKLAPIKDKLLAANGAKAIADIQSELANTAIKLQQLTADKVTTQTNTKSTVIDRTQLSEPQWKMTQNLNQTYEKRATDIRETLKVVDNFEALVKRAINGDQGAVSQLSFQTARIASGAGVITDNDLRNAGVNLSVFQQLNSRINQKVFGTPSNHEIEEYKKLAISIKGIGEKKLGELAHNYTELAKRRGLPPDLVVHDDRERFLGEGRTTKTPSELAKQYGGTQRK